MTLSISCCIAVSSWTHFTLISVYCVVRTGWTQKLKRLWVCSADTGWWLVAWVELAWIRSVRESFCPSSPAEQEARNWQQCFLLLLCPSPPVFLWRKRNIRVRQKKAGGRNVGVGVGGGEENLNVSSLLQIRCWLKSWQNPPENLVWFEGLLVQLGPDWQWLWLNTFTGN